MFIANPIYDTVFKYLMEDNKYDNLNLSKLKNMPREKELTDIIDIKPPQYFDTGFNIFDYWLYAVIAAVIIIIMAALFFYLKKRKQKKAKTSAPISAEQKAFRSLLFLAEDENIEIKLFYFKLSIILRSYIYERFNINAPEMTTEEFLPQIKKLNLEMRPESELKNFFLSADPVKFAGKFRDREKMKKDLEFVKKFVKETAIIKNEL